MTRDELVKAHAERAVKQEAMVRAEYEKFTDWRGVCKKCGRPLQGTLADLRAHMC